MRAKLVYGKNSMTWANRVYAYTNRRETATPNYQPQYNPHKNTYRYVPPGVSPQYNPYSNRSEYPK
jgi:hypothetical protein